MIRPILITLLLFALCGIAADARGQLYQYTDKNGNIVITDRPTAGSNATEKQLRDDNLNWSNVGEADHSSDREAGTREPARETKRRDYSDATAIMYMADWCGYCRKAGQYIRSLGAHLIEYNIDRDADKKEEMLKKSGGSRAIPLIDIDGTIVRGYNPSAIKAALDRSVAR